MKKTLQIIILLLLAVPAFAQTGSLKGKVLDNNQEPLIGVTVLVLGTEKGAVTDIDGTFTVGNLPTGQAVARVSFVGFKTVELPITIEANQATTLEDITLYEGNEILQDVVVTGERINQFSREQTAYVSKLPLKDLENTQVYSTITNELLVSQTVTNFEDALKNATGVDKLWTSTGRGGDGAGYYSLRGFSVQPQLVNGKIILLIKI